MDFKYEHVKILIKNWRKWGEFLSPGPLASFLTHPNFAEAVKHSDFWSWIKNDMTQFCKLGANQGMYSANRLAILGNTPMLRFQY